MKKNVEPGSFVGPGLPVFALANTDIVKIVIGVPDTTVRSIRLGQPVDVTVDAFANRTFQRADQPHRVGCRSEDTELRGRGRRSRTAITR